MGEQRTIPRELLNQPPQPLRFAMDEQKMNDLVDSLRQYGVILPLAVVPVGERYEIVDGHRRYIAAGIAGITDLPCVVFDSLEDAKYGMMLHANVMREDVTAAEEGYQFVELAEKRGWSMAELVRFFGRSSEYIDARARLVTKFTDVAKAVLARDVNFSQATQIMRCSDAAWRTYLLDQASTHGASARTLGNMVDQWKTQQNLAEGKPAVHSAEHADLYVEKDLPPCPYCNRADDTRNMVDVKMHSYHVRDLLALLDQVGVNGENTRLRQGLPGPAGGATG